MRSTSAASGSRARARSPEIPHTVGKQGYAVVSCHVEELLDDRTFARYLRFVARRPSGFAVASLVRAPAVGEDEALWAERVRELAAHGPLGQHTHWGGRTQARPVEGEPAERVRREAEVFRAAGLAPTWFCGGGWYVDEAVVEAVAELGYRDCTATSFRPSYLPAGAPRLAAERATWLRIGAKRLFELPTTHSLGPGARAAVGRLPDGTVHLYFHDYELNDPRRRLALTATLALLARRRTPVDLDRLAEELAPDASEERLHVARA
jgi:hypothetical protein